MADLTEKKESEKHIMDKKTTKKEKHTEINTQKQKTQPKKQQQQQKKQKTQQQNKKKAKKKAEVSLGETYSSPNWSVVLLNYDGNIKIYGYIMLTCRRST